MTICCSWVPLSHNFMSRIKKVRNILMHKKFNFYQFLSLLEAPVNWIPYQAQRHIKELNQKNLYYFFLVFLVALSNFVSPALVSSSLIANSANAIVGLEIKIPITARTAASLVATHRGGGIH